MSEHLTLFDTSIGTCAIVFGPNGMIGMQLPRQTPESLRARTQRLHPRTIEMAETEVGEEARKAIDGVRRLLAGERLPLLDIRIDYSGVPDFNVRVYEVSRRIPPGDILTYGEVAARIGEPRTAQAVGQALGANPFAPVVPCHRILAKGGGYGGFSAHGGTDTKLRLLRIEGAEAAAQMSLFDQPPS